MKKLFVLAFLLLAGEMLMAQQSGNPIPYFTYGKGLGITSPDSLFQLNIRFRIQNRIALKTAAADEIDNIEEVEARIRRLRLRFDGFIYSPKLTYVIQLAFSRGDWDYADTGYPNVIRDAMVIYSVNEHFAIGMGQTKLPGNRQRVNSSGDLQLPDRSIVNARFNIDRDFGLQFYYNNHFSNFHYVLRGAISSGEGRNIDSSDKGLAYTGRVELLPFGRFTNNGDYFEGDLVREKKPKVSIGFTASNNENSHRTGGQLGKPLFEARDIETGMIDFLLKYNGWAFATEFVKRTSYDPITTDIDGNIRYVFVGHGQNFQGSYLFPNNFELTARYSEVIADEDIQTQTPDTHQYTMGFTKYFRGHRVKLQSDLTYEDNLWQITGTENTNNWQWRFQIEVGI